MSAGPRLLLTTDAVGGVWTYALELASALSERGVAVELAVVGPAASPAQAEAAKLAGARLHETGLPLEWTATSPAALAGIGAALATLARELSVDLVQLHSPALVGAASWPAPVLAVAHSCVGTWWAAVRGDATPPPDFAWRMAAMARGLRAADAVLAPSRAFADALRRIYGAGLPVGVVHNGRVPLPFVAPKARKGVLVAGRLWDEGKNVATLDRAAARMQADVSAAGSLAGPNGLCVELSAIAPLGIVGQAGMVAAMASARIFASPSLYEPFGLAVLEAAQAGLPLVLADIPTFRELWDGAALFVPPRDVTAWAATLDRLHADPDACRRHGEAARARARRYTAERFALAMTRQLGRLLATPRAATAA